jgi:precorrin-2/cobalt-factor-2 C20-methyltransferase
MNTSSPGTLYGIGVGPGDPELIPLKAVRILSRVDVIFAAASTKNDHSQAVNIARPHIPATTKVRRLSFPMSKDPAVKQAAWQEHARTLIGELSEGRQVAFLTLGDSMTYATYGYIVKYVQMLAPHIPIVTIPGITSYQAAAARVNMPLVEGEESLLLLSGVEGGHRLRQLSACAENVVFLKAYRNTADIIQSLDEADMLATSVCVANCGLQNEEIIHDIRELAHRPPDYWTLIIAKKNNNHHETQK